MYDKPITTAHPVELLAVSTARIAGEAKLLLTVRLGGENFESINLAHFAQQARRLLDDLTERFQRSKLLEQAGTAPDEAKVVFERIMFDLPSPDTSREEETE